MQKVIVLRFTVWSILAPVSTEERRFFLEHYLDDVRLLASHDLRDLFPDAFLIKERILGLTKSLVVVKNRRRKIRYR